MCMEPKGIGPGKYYRRGLTLIELFQMLPNEPAAEQWFINARWPHGPAAMVQVRVRRPELARACPLRLAGPARGTVKVNVQSTSRQNVERTRDSLLAG